MNIEPNDPRVTAYALGELPESEVERFERALAESPGAQAEVEALRALSSELSEHFSESDSTLSSAQRQRIEQALTDGLGPERSSARGAERGGSGKKLLRRVLLAASVTLPMAAAAVLYVSSAGRSPEEQHAVGYVDGKSMDLPPATASSAATKLPGDQGALGRGKFKSDTGERLPGFTHDTESYDSLADNPFISVKTDPRSTFSVDVDTASYSIVRRFVLRDGKLPPKGAVRIEELINYFQYDYPAPPAGSPFAVSTEVSAAPWAAQHRLVRIGIKAQELKMSERPPLNMVFLLDVSGSMSAPDKLPLLKRALKLVVEQMDERDTVAMVVYAGASGLVLPPTRGSNKDEILSTLEQLDAGGSTNGGEGIELAYRTAESAFVKDGVNRVVLATDGDFNVGVTNQSDLVDLIERKAKTGVFLSVLGFGMGNYKDSTLEKLANKGNGNYAYIDDIAEARKVLVEQAAGTFVTVAKDVKLQLEFNPLAVEAFRLIGYENRVLAHRDFNDDKKDAGDIGAGHTVTALYEVVPAGGKVPGGDVDGLKYQKPTSPSTAAHSGELLTVRLRYKAPDGQQSQLMEVPIRDSDKRLSDASHDFRFASAVAAFGMLLRDSEHKGNATYDQVLGLAAVGEGRDHKSRAEFRKLVEAAAKLARQRAVAGD